MSNGTTKEEIIKKLEEIKNNYFIKIRRGDGFHYWDEEKARQGSEKFNLLMTRYFTSRDNHARFIIETGLLRPGNAIRDVQPYIDSAFGKIEALIEDIKEHGYKWDDYHPKPPSQPTTIEQWLNANKNTINLIKSIVPAFIAIFFSVTGEYQNIDLSGVGLLAITILAIFFPELRDIFKKGRN